MEEIKKQLKQIIKELFDIEIEPEVTEAPEGVEADYSSNVAMRLAGRLHKKPMEIAEEIKKKSEELSSSDTLKGARPSLWSSEDNSFAFSIIISAPGFLNFISPDEYFVGKLGEIRGNFDEFISCDEYSGKTVICEFSDPNPFKVLHVGHLYTSVVGDSISRLFEYAGAKVVRANFGGDVGLHVAKTLYTLRKKVNVSSETQRSAGPSSRAAAASFSAAASETVSEKTFTFSIEDIAKCYVEGTRAYEEDEEAKKEITKINKEIYEINKNDIHGTELADLYWKGRELSYDYFKDFYAKIGLSFDKYYPESSVAGLGLEKVKEQLAAGVYEESDGATVFKGEKYDLHTRVFINKEGVPTYEAKDVGLIFTKWQDYKFDKSVIITANEQLEYMKVVLKSVEQYAPELVERTTHLTHGIVKLPGSVKMSSRKGNFLKAVDVLDLISGELKENYNSEDEKVSLGATKYAFLKYKMGGDIVFDPKESVKMTGNSGPYLQYAAVRAKKIIDKSKELSSSMCSCKEHKIAPSAGALRAARPSLTPAEGTILVLNQHERNLIKKIVQYKEVLSTAVKEMAPHKVCNYLYELAQEFSRFYENCPVVGDEKEAERVQIVDCYLKVLTHGLGLLGIEIPEEM